MKRTFLILSTVLILPLCSYASEQLPELDINKLKFGTKKEEQAPPSSRARHLPDSQDFEVKVEKGQILKHKYIITYKGKKDYRDFACRVDDTGQKGWRLGGTPQNVLDLEVSDDKRHVVKCYKSGLTEDMKPENIIFEFDIPLGG